MASFRQPSIESLAIPNDAFNRYMGLDLRPSPFHGIAEVLEPLTEGEVIGTLTLLS